MAMEKVFILVALAVLVTSCGKDTRLIGDSASGIASAQSAAKKSPA
jgi:hypothetical protein